MIVNSCQMVKRIGLILQVGTAVSALLVLVGGISLLWQHGNDAVLLNLYSIDAIQWTYSSLMNPGTMKPLDLIEAGLMILVLTQLVRVFLLIWYYVFCKDYWFIGITSIIFLILSTSFLWS